MSSELMSSRTTRHTHVLDDLVARCRGEFLEMPGLRLTLPEAARLWNVDVTLCGALLDALVESGFLRKARDNYMRANLGRGAA